MKTYNLDDTIAAVATPIGEAGIGIVRISGREALAVADKIFISKAAGSPRDFATYTTHYGWVVSGFQPDTEGSRQPTANSRQDIVDEVILTVMRAPRSYTKEDIVEINCHGGSVALQAVLDLVLKSGCRLAEPGEFTKRAFLNGRIDLAQAEAVLDIIRAKTDSALRMGVEQLRGNLSRRIGSLRNRLLGVISRIEADIDFGEEEKTPVDAKRLSSGLTRINQELRGILQAAGYGRILREGIKVVICGKPNVGKSSLLNALLRQERSIVTAIAGTTRDTVEEIINIRGIPVRIIDTAGIIEPRDLIEKKAVWRAKRYMDSADLALLLFDGSGRLSEEDAYLMQRLKNKPALAVINKADLKQKIGRAAILRRFGRVTDISAKKMQNIGALEDSIVNSVLQGEVSSRESILVSNARHIEAIRQAQKLIAESLNSLDNKLSLEFVAQDVRAGLLCLEELLGRKFSQDLLDRIFSEFCIGK